MKIQLAHIPFDGVKYENPPFDGIISVRIEGQIYKSDDIVVVGGHIGNIEGVDLEDKIAHLGLSYEYEECMADPEDWTMHSGHSCSYKGIRHATDEEIKKYNISAGLTCNAFEAADRAYKERRIWGY